MQTYNPQIVQMLFWTDKTVRADACNIHQETKNLEPNIHILVAFSDDEATFYIKWIREKTQLSSGLLRTSAVVVYTNPSATGRMQHKDNL